jgi:hypothetical protein
VKEKPKDQQHRVYKPENCKEENIFAGAMSFLVIENLLWKVMMVSQVCLRQNGWSLFVLCEEGKEAMCSAEVGAGRHS